MNGKWRFSAVVTGLLVIGAVRAQSGPDEIALAIPSPASADPAVVTPASLGSPSMPIPALPPAPAASAADAARARAAIERANSEWLTAFRGNDVASLAKIYAPDASLFPPSNVGLEGRDRIVEYFEAQRNAGMGDPSLKTLDVVCIGDVAYEVGTYGFRFDGRGGDSGRYFTIWKGMPDGSWRYQVGIWSSNRDAVANAR